MSQNVKNISMFYYLKTALYPPAYVYLLWVGLSSDATGGQILWFLCGRASKTLPRPALFLDRRRTDEGRDWRDGNEKKRDTVKRRNMKITQRYVISMLQFALSKPLRSMADKSSIYVFLSKEDLCIVYRVSSDMNSLRNRNTGICGLKYFKKKMIPRQCWCRF